MEGKVFQQTTINHAISGFWLRQTIKQVNCVLVIHTSRVLMHRSKHSLYDYWLVRLGFSSRHKPHWLHLLKCRILRDCTWLAVLSNASTKQELLFNHAFTSPYHIWIDILISIVRVGILLGSRQFCSSWFIVAINVLHRNHFEWGRVSPGPPHIVLHFSLSS